MPRGPHRVARPRELHAWSAPRKDWTPPRHSRDQFHEAKRRPRRLDAERARFVGAAARHLVAHKIRRGWQSRPTPPLAKERTIATVNAWHNAFSRLQRCYERREEMIDAFFDLADAITLHSLIRQAWTLYRWDSRPARRP
jgi:hypothetical protein